MIKKRPLLTSFLSSALFFSYISLISWVLNHGEEIFKSNSDFPVAIFMLSLFVFSALITGLLLLGAPIYLYFEKEKKIAFKILSFNILFLAIIILAFALFQILI